MRTRSAEFPWRFPAACCSLAVRCLSDAPAHAAAAPSHPHRQGWWRAPPYAPSTSRRRRLPPARVQRGGGQAPRHGHTDCLSSAPHSSAPRSAHEAWRLRAARHSSHKEWRPATNALGARASRPPQPYSSVRSRLGCIPRHNCTAALLGPLTLTLTLT